jgi:hypothetical protein
MGGPIARIGAAGLALLVGASAYMAVGLHLYDSYRRAYSNYQVDPAGPCGVLITWSPPSDVLTAFYANQPQFLVARYRSPHPQALRLTLGIPSFTQDQSFDVQGTPAFQAQAFKPPLINPTVLDTLVGPHARDAQIVLRVRNESGRVCDTSWPVQLESRQMMQWQDAAGNDESGYLAGWVTPQDDVISTLVGRTADWLTDPAHRSSYPNASALFGYNNPAGGQASPSAVIDQVNALFDTLQFVYHVHYVDENVPFQQNTMQLIQLPKDMLDSPAPTGMCVETTALMASAIERMGMRPFIVIVPHHAFLGVALGHGLSAPLSYWETSDLNGGLNGDQANIHGTTEYNTFKQQGQILRVIDVEQERQLDIQPIE